MPKAPILTTAELEMVLEDAAVAAVTASARYVAEVLGGRDQYPCGFSYVNVYNIRGNSKLGDVLRKYGFRKNDGKGFSRGAGAFCRVQNVNAAEAAMQAYADHLRKAGVEVSVTAYLD